jgi:predicted ATPase
LYPSALDRACGQIAAHYERGGLPAQALPFYQRAAEAAERLFAMREAIQNWESALKLLQALPDRSRHATDELALLTTLGSAMTTVKGWSAPEIKEIYSAALPLCEEVGDSTQRYRILWGLQSYYQVQADFAQCSRFAEEMLKLARQEQDSTLLAYAYFHLGTVKTQQGQFAQGAELFAKIITYFDLPNPSPVIVHLRPDYSVFTRLFATIPLWHMGYAEQALALGQEAYARATSMARPYDLVVALIYVATLHLFCRQTEQVQMAAQVALLHSEEHSFAYYAAYATILLGWVAVEQGEVDKGIEQMRRGLLAFDNTGAQIRRPYYVGLLALALGKAGQTEEGLELLTQAISVSSARGEGWPEAELHRCRGELLLAQGNEQEAEQAFEQAFAVARTQQAKSMELRVMLSLCRLWQQQGNIAQAHHLLAEVYGWFSEGFDLPDMIEARALLQSLMA